MKVIKGSEIDILSSIISFLTSFVIVGMICNFDEYMDEDGINENFLCVFTILDAFIRFFDVLSFKFPGE